MWTGVGFALAAGLLWGGVFVGPLLLPDYPAALQSVGRYLAFGLIALPLAWLDRAALHTAVAGMAATLTEPSLAQMTTKALEILSAKTKENKRGFFLQVEGASIDKQDHAENPCGQIGETIAFDRAIQVAVYGLGCGMSGAWWRNQHNKHHDRQ